MTLRDWFAGQAIGAVIRQCAGDAAFGYPEGVTSMEQLFASKAYAVADAMLTERAKPVEAPAETLQHVAYFDEGEFHWMSGVAPRDCELYAKAKGGAL